MKKYLTAVMFMTDVIDTSFNYRTLDEVTADTLQAKAYRINKITNESAYEIGKELKEAQHALSKKGYGCFTEWFESLGFKKTKAYQYINHYDFVRSESERSNIEKFENLPKSLQSEMSKPSANDELNQKVYDGDITTHKQYKELEQELKDKETQLESIKRSEQIAIEQLEKEQSKEPKTVEIIPGDYESLKVQISETKNAYKGLKKEYNRLKTERDRENKDDSEKSKKYEELSEAIQEMEGQMTRGQKRIQAQKDVYDLVSKSKELLVEITPIPYLINAEYVKENEFARKALLNLSDQVEKFLDNLHKVIDDNKFIEGEIIND